MAGCPLLAYHYLCHTYGYDPALALAALRKPVLALFAEHDPMVPPANLARMRALLVADADALFVVLPRSNHLFWTSNSGLRAEYERLIGPEAVSPHARSGNAGSERLSRSWSNRAPYAEG